MDLPKPSTLQILLQALRHWPQTALPARLEQIYAALPATACARQGACCGLLPPVQPVEMLAFLGELQQGEEKARGETALMLVRHFLQNAARRLPCPWALLDSCARYEGRFFGCRAYGLWSPAAYELRRRESLDAAQKVQASWESMGITLPQEVCAPPPAYCSKVEPVAVPAPDDVALDKLESALAGLGQDQAWHAFLAQFGGDLSYLLAGLALGWRECLQAKVAVTRALLNGQTAETEARLFQAEQAARAWTRDLADA
jgi:hypothetical protein